MPARETIKTLLLQRCMTITELARKLTEITGKKYSRSALSAKLSRNSLKYKELEQIAKILEYKIDFVDLINN